MDLMREMPGDGDLRTALKDLSARKTMDEGGYGALEGGGGSYRDILKDKKEAVSLEQEKRVQKSEDVTERLIGEYEARLPDRAGQPQARPLARRALHAEKTVRPRPRTLRPRQEIRHGQRPVARPSHRRHHRQAVRFPDWSSSTPSTPDHAAQVEKIKAEKLAFQVAECQKRVEKYPTDLAIRYEMGVLYFQTGKIGEAIAEFQKAQGNPYKRLAAMSYLAQCFAKRKMFDLAARTLQNAIKEKPVFDDEKKDLIYNLGCVLESMGKKEEAIEQFKQIYESDAGYKDVAAKVDAFYAGQ